VPFAQLGLRSNLPKEELGKYTWQVLERVPDIVALGGALLYGVYWITKRREYVRQVEGEAGGKERS
jgi:formate dehydrogenase iron-sulfur subunit